MSTQTNKLGLFKYDPIIDKEELFDIQTSLNDNWDKIDAAIVQSDWNQNNNSAIDYIKNRPFYTEVAPIQLIDNQSITTNQFGIVSLSNTSILVAGQVYTVILNNVAYECIARAVGEVIVIGNGTISGIDEINNEEPFVCRSDIYNGCSFHSETNAIATYTLSISTIGEVITKIDGKYLINSNVVNGLGSYSIVEGKESIASGIYSHAEGYNTTASGEAAHAEGYRTNANAVAHAEGYSTEANGVYSHAEGYNTTASGEASHAEGKDTTASNKYSHAEGRDTTSSGTASHAEGDYTTANGDYSHTEGQRTVASAYGSHAEGLYSEANGQGTHAEGYQTRANSEYQHVQGKCNIIDDSNTYAHIVGNGTNPTSANRSNAHTLDWEGNAWFASDVYVGSTSGTNKDDGSKKLATEEFVETEIAALVNSAPETLDTLGELATAFNENKEVVDALDEAIATKANRADVYTKAEVDAAIAAAIEAAFANIARAEEASF